MGAPLEGAAVCRFRSYPDANADNGADDGSHNGSDNSSDDGPNDRHNDRADEYSGADCRSAIITKQPTKETVEVGGSATFVANATGWAWCAWRFLSPDGKTEVIFDVTADKFPGLTITGGNSTTMYLTNIPMELNGWKAVCLFSSATNLWTYTDGTAVITVNAAATPTPSPTPEPTATPEPDSDSHAHADGSPHAHTDRRSGGPSMKRPTPVARADPGAEKGRPAVRRQSTPDRPCCGWPCCSLAEASRREYCLCGKRNSARNTNSGAPETARFCGGCRNGGLPTLRARG